METKQDNLPNELRILAQRIASDDIPDEQSVAILMKAAAEIERLRVERLTDA